MKRLSHGEPAKFHCYETLPASPSISTTSENSTNIRYLERLKIYFFRRQSLDISQMTSQVYISSECSSSNNCSQLRRILTTRRTLPKSRLTVEQTLNQSQKASVNSVIDQCLHLSQRTLRNKLEKLNPIKIENIRYFQTEISCNTRRDAIGFLSEICKLERADPVVLPSAILYMDTILSTAFVPQRLFVPISAACLFVATKMKAPHPITAQQIVDYSRKLSLPGLRPIDMDELIHLESWLVGQLEWNFCTDTAWDFVDQLIVRSPLLDLLKGDIADVLLALYKDLDLATLSAGLQAAACLLYLADRTNKQHFIMECEEVIQKYLYLNPSEIRQKYLTNIQFAMDDIFFDDDELQPIAPKRLCDVQYTTSNRACAIFGFLNNNNRNNMNTTNYNNNNNNNINNQFYHNSDTWETEEEKYVILSDVDDEDFDLENFFDFMEKKKRNTNNHEAACRNLDLVLAQDFNPCTPERKLSETTTNSVDSKAGFQQMRSNQQLQNSESKFSEDSGMDSPSCAYSL